MSEHIKTDQMRYLMEESALAIGFSRWREGRWLNSWGAEIPISPADYPWNAWKGVLLRYFEPSLQNKITRATEKFLAEHREDMTPEELCELVIRLKN